MLVGYMRVSSDPDRQTTDLQRDALRDAGVDLRQLVADKARNMVQRCAPITTATAHLCTAHWRASPALWRKSRRF